MMKLLFMSSRGCAGWSEAGQDRHRCQGRTWLLRGQGTRPNDGRSHATVSGKTQTETESEI